MILATACRSARAARLAAAPERIRAARELAQLTPAAGTPGFGSVLDRWTAGSSYRLSD